MIQMSRFLFFTMLKAVFLNVICHSSQFPFLSKNRLYDCITNFALHPCTGGGDACEYDNLLYFGNLLYQLFYARNKLSGRFNQRNNILFT